MQIRDLVPWSRSTRTVERSGEAADHPFLGLQREINRVFDTFWSRFDGPAANGNASLAGVTSLSPPLADVSETDQAVEVTIELPGLDQKDIDITLSDDVLTIRGEKKSERTEDKKGYYLAERRYGSFYRTILLPPGVDTGKAEARFRQGVLTVTLPKTDEAQQKLRRIEVKAA